MKSKRRKKKHAQLEAEEHGDEACKVHDRKNGEHDGFGLSVFEEGTDGNHDFVSFYN